MKNNIWTIAKKEFSRFFGDKRMVLSTLLLPGLMIYVMYTFMGSAMADMHSVEEDFKPVIYVENLPESIQAAGEGAGLELLAPAQDIQDIKQQLTDKDGGIHVLAVFPEDFDTAVSEYNSLSKMPAPAVEVYFNSASTESRNAYDTFTGVLDSYESMLANKFDVNPGDGVYDLATKEDSTGQIFASMLPMLMMIFLFSGCVSVAPESIAGEKERGTIAPLLITPVKRSEIAVGKIISLSCIALLSGLSSFLGTFLSMPKLMAMDEAGMDASIYQVSDYILLFFVILSTVLVIIGMISIISAYAKTIKEATTMVTPLMIISMVLGITSMFGNGAKEGMGFYFIPLYNSVQCMSGIFSKSYSTPNIVVAIVANVCYMFLCTFILAKMFSSEKVVFSK